MLTLALLKAHLKLDAAPGDEDPLLQAYLAAALGAFKVESKRRWPVVGEPAIVKTTDPIATPPTTEFVAYVDPAVLSADEQALADQWLRLAIGHWYENKQEVLADVRAVAVQVPMACGYLMNLVRTPTL
ncbi:hypothetical protein [Hymenobacter cheonanensis]|uniref:hypothetical protein n=1 Tax=Hymenobacter sp. CA2-7 TaxID=3063993 RepID=UPI0027141B2C|nr:hypothetical protein [Hymenobacter sp. CA2-7]MDO7888282.1 hypothetical protein [Hymenobacter sp. CA2-7]